MDFYQRFKGRISTLTKDGIARSSLDTPVLKSGVSPIKASATSIISSTPRLSGMDSHSIREVKGASTDRQRSDVSQTYIMRTQTYQSPSYMHKKIGYRPYNLADYRCIANQQYYELRGLGPSSIGSDEWKKKVEQLKRRKEYAHSLKAPRKFIEFSSFKKERILRK